MKFSEQPPSQQWAALRHRGEKLAEVWFKPDGEPLGLVFRIPQQTFLIPGAGPGLTAGNLLKSLGIATEEVDSWRLGESGDSSTNRAGRDLDAPLPTPKTTHLNILVCLKPPSQELAASEGGEPATVPANADGQEVDSAEPATHWQDLETRYNTLRGMEAAIETLRLTLEGIRAELEGLVKKPLAPEEKLHARRDDVARWEKEKKRVYFAVPKLKEFTHRATWAAGAPERKQLDELFKNEAQPELEISEMIRIGDQLMHLLKERQILSGQGVAVQQECRTIAANIQQSLRTLQSNAVANKERKRRAQQGGKFFKDARKATGLE
jgi:hypothetical protein